MKSGDTPGRAIHVEWNLAHCYAPWTCLLLLSLLCFRCGAKRAGPTYTRSEARTKSRRRTSERESRRRPTHLNIFTLYLFCRSVCAVVKQERGNPLKLTRKGSIYLCDKEEANAGTLFTLHFIPLLCVRNYTFYHFAKHPNLTQEVRLDDLFVSTFCLQGTPKITSYQARANNP